MRVLLCGTRSFGCAVYDRLRELGHDVPIAVGDVKLNIHVLTRGGRACQAISPALVRNEKADLIVAAHSHQFIGRESRAAATYGAIGYHPSLLPRHRGKDAVRWTVHMHDPIAGGSVYWLTDNVDGGPLQAQDWCHVRPGDDHHTLWREELFPMGVDLLGGAVQQIDQGFIRQVPQDESVATWEPAWERPPLH